VRVLVVEDFDVLAQSVATGLRREGMAVDVALDGNAALDHVGLTDYDVVILDRDLPGVSGDEVCRRVAAARSSTRILMLTASGTITDRIAGLELGADDYLPKPFHFPELVLRVQALARRKPTAKPRILRHGNFELDGGRRTATRSGVQLDLSRNEYNILEALIRAAPAPLSAEALLTRVWDENADPFTKTVTVTISRLRRKLGHPDIIDTIRGVGYRIVASTAEQENAGQEKAPRGVA
jgi:DNA-binding response OmpR family regulator